MSNRDHGKEDHMSISVTATEVVRDFDGVMKKAQSAGGVTIIKNNRPIATITPIDQIQPSEQPDVVETGKQFISEYSDVFTELAK